MSKAYWINVYHSVKDPEAFAEYAKLGAPALQKHGGQFLVRGLPDQVYEAGLMERVTVVQFDSVEQAVAAHDSPEYQEALRVLGDSAERDLRIVEGLELD